MIRADQAQLPPIIRDNLDQIEKLCKKYGVRKLDIFGSALRDDFRVDSDLDFTVEFRPDAPREGWGGAYMALMRALKEALSRDVDLVEYSAVRNPYFKAELDETRVNIYAE